MTGPAVLEDAEGCLVQTDGPMVALVGVSDLVVVVSEGAVIVVPRDQTQRVKAVVDTLKAMDRDDLL